MHTCHGHRYRPSPVPLCGTGTIKGCGLTCIWSRCRPVLFRAGQCERGRRPTPGQRTHHWTTSPCTTFLKTTHKQTGRAFGFICIYKMWVPVSTLNAIKKTLYHLPENYIQTVGFLFYLHLQDAGTCFDIKCHKNTVPPS